MEAIDVQRIAQTQDPNVSGVALLTADRVAEAGWTVVVNTASGHRIRIDTASGVAPLQAARDAVTSADLSDTATATRDATARRTTAQAAFQSLTDIAVVERAAALVVMDRINELRDWITSFKAAFAAATSLSNSQTRVAALPAMPDFTASQIKTAIANKIASGDAD